MAYMNQEHKKELAPGIKAVLKKYGMKGTIAVSNYSTLVVSVSQGPLDIIGNNNEQRRLAAREDGRDLYLADGYIDVNCYCIDTSYTGEARKFLQELHAAMNVGNHDRSDIQSDYFDVGWYTSINVGRWNKPYVCTTEEVAS